MICLLAGIAKSVSLGVMLEELKEEVLKANLMLVTEGLVRLTWGNVSGVDREKGMFVIKPSGVAYEDLTRDSLVVLDLEGNVVEGSLRPSSDTPTHRILYCKFPQIGGVTHTHSVHATMFSQAGVELPCQGTTHADHFFGTVPVVRELTEAEVAEDYETNTGRAIAQHFHENEIEPMEMPACFQKYHAPFTWGKNAVDSVKNSVALEVCAQMALGTWQLSAEQSGLPLHLLDKHYLRKHGSGAYYGQG
ncbi:MAG: L-ribulose-5-phosphate 4-epimerase AraD [Verrucomicrobiales bacterium]|nr:L-ribulose-5-phosphate 4-epimerase AraD [Verrucomicrobiales bacterium]